MTERVEVTVGEEQTADIGKELMRRIQDIAKERGTHETIAVLVHVAGWLAGRTQFGLENRASIRPALELFSRGYVAGMIRSKEEEQQDDGRNNNDTH